MARPRSYNLILLPRGPYFRGTVRDLLDTLIRMPDVRLIGYLAR